MAQHHHDNDDPSLSTAPHHLGFVEPIEDLEHFQEVAFRSPNFNLWDGGQLGGSPSWLDPEHIPQGPLKCNNNNTNNNNNNNNNDDDRILQFVCQIYAPVDGLDDERAFHRALYVFAAPPKSPDDKPCIRVLRAQLPQDNPYFPSDPVDDDITNWKQHLPSHIKLCSVCGLRASYVCPKQQQPFCCREHQKEYFHHVTHASTTTDQQQQQQQEQQSPSFLVELPSLYPLAEIVVEAEEVSSTSNKHDDNSDNDVEDEHLETQHAEMNKIVTLFPNTANTSNQDGNDDDANLEQEDLNRMLRGGEDQQQQQQHQSAASASLSTDPVTQRFVERCQSHPDQILRYCRWKGSPIWFQSNDQGPSINSNSTDIPPPCLSCGAPRRFEFQIMPQILHFLQKKKNSTHTTPKDPRVEEQWKQVLQAMQDADSWIEQTPPEHIPPSLVDAKERATRQYQQAMLQNNPRELDFGTIAVYTCTNSCNGDGAGDETSLLGRYQEEYAWVQTTPPLPASSK